MRADRVDNLGSVCVIVGVCICGAAPSDGFGMWLIVGGVVTVIGLPFMLRGLWRWWNADHRKGWR